jgi:hypothetical protein
MQWSVLAGRFAYVFTFPSIFIYILVYVYMYVIYGHWKVIVVIVLRHQSIMFYKVLVVIENHVMPPHKELNN